MKKLFASIAQQCRKSTQGQSAIKGASNEHLVTRVQTLDDQQAVGELIIRHQNLMASKYFSLAGLVDVEEYEGEALSVFTKAIQKYNVIGSGSFTTYFQHCLENHIVNMAKNRKSQKRSLCEESLFCELSTVGENGEVIEFDIPDPVEMTDKSITHILDGYNLTESERDYCVWISVYGKGYQSGSGSSDADYARARGVTRQAVYNMKQSLKVKLAGLLPSI